MASRLTLFKTTARKAHPARAQAPFGVRVQLGSRVLFSGYSFPALHVAPARSVIRYPSANSWLKSAMDRVGAATLLILLAPVMLLLMALVRRDGGPAFYAQLRIGQNGKPFHCWKFRSMHVNSKQLLEEILANDPAAREEYARDFKLKNDPRVTAIGNILRSSSLDELPQLYNVLCGEMSLVGPRPITEPELQMYGVNQPDYLAVRPGMTGLWQVSGRNDISYAQRVALDVSYARNWSLLEDVRILLKTVLVVLNRSGAY
jgi:Undecaprenyl-phosphate galactose phosphotransferase WbaP